MKKLKISSLLDKHGVSHTISAVIITATTIILVLVASIYAYQVLDQQRAMAEFEMAKKSILAFNDALENVAWKPEASRSVRFTIEYGELQLLPDCATLGVNATVGDDSVPLNSIKTGYVRYCIKNKYVNLGEGYQSYILGNDRSIVVNNADSYGKALIEQTSGLVNITLNYRVRAMRTSVIQVGGQTVNYVDIWIIKVVIGYWSSYVHDFDLKTRCLNVTTTTYGQYGPYPPGSNCAISVQLNGGPPSEATISLDSGEVVFNVIIAEMQVWV